MQFFLASKFVTCLKSDYELKRSIATIKRLNYGSERKVVVYILILEQ